jgi:hypothetical protein
LKSTLITLALLMSLNSCSWYRDFERSMVDEKGSASSRTVSRAQYDQLLLKYEELSKKYEELKERPPGSQDTLVDELQRSQSENFAKTSSNVETVDVFPADATKSPPTATIEVPADVEAQLSLYRKGISLKESNQSEATKIFQQLENKAIAPVKVRSKYQIGDMLLKQGQHDLALQVFEDIISKNADSGVVLDALNGAIAASEKLGMNTKKDQYTSMLNDVFGAR